jgi:hypothetical protein
MKRIPLLVLTGFIFGSSIIAACGPRGAVSDGGAELETVVAATLTSMTAAAPPAASPSVPENMIRFTYRNVSLITPPFLSNKITAERLELREQLNPADDVPGYIQIDIREPWDVDDENGLYSQVLVYPLGDLVQTYPEAADAAAKLGDILQGAEESLPGELPFWPLVRFSGVIGTPLESPGKPALFTHAQRLDFGSGGGVRYVTLLESQPAKPYKLAGLIYTYQGLTGDGKYYVSVILPISIPHEEAINADLEQLADVNAIAQTLSVLDGDQFQLSLAECDGLVRSLVVGP